VFDVLAVASNRTIYKEMYEKHLLVGSHMHEGHTLIKSFARDMLIEIGAGLKKTNEPFIRLKIVKLIRAGL
jgi:hypothetical protein